MDGRKRVLVALDGGRPDRVPRAWNFYPVDSERLRPPDGGWEEPVDVEFVRFEDTSGDRQLREMLQQFPVDTRLGTAAQAANYARWQYHPEASERRNPLARATSLAELEEFPFPDGPVDDDMQTGLSRQVSVLHGRGLAAGGCLPHLGGDLFETAWRLRGLENLLVDFVERPDWARFLLDRLTDAAVAKAEALAQANADVMALSDDVGMPGRMLISPEYWREFLKPRMASIIEAAQRVNADLRVIYHSDGYYEPIIADLAEIGVNAINPVQPEHMNAVRIRRRFGPAVAMWGTLGRQATFSRGTPEEIRREVKERIDTLGHAGLILCPAYDIDWPDIRHENIAAFLEAVELYGS